MAQARLSVRKIREVLRLKAEARLSDREIAAAIGSARSTVQECLRRARAAGIAWPLPAECDEEALAALIGADATWPYAALLRRSMDSTVTLAWEVGVEPVPRTSLEPLPDGSALSAFFALTASGERGRLG